MRILVTFAVDAEFAPWRRRHPFVAFPIKLEHRYFQESFYRARVGPADVTVYLTGIGWTVPHYGLDLLLSEGPNACISSGLAGGLKPHLKKGTVVAAQFASLLDGRGFIGANTLLLEAARDSGATIANKCLTSKHILGQAQFKRATGEFADFVDMESFHIMEKLTGRKIPGIIIRSISDTVMEDLPLDFSHVLDHNGRILKRQLALQLARYPHKIFALIRFGRESQQSAEGLANFLDRYIELIAKRGPVISDVREQVPA